MDITAFFLQCQDDTQLNISFGLSPTKAESQTSQGLLAISYCKKWNWLILNSERTVMLVIS